MSKNDSKFFAELKKIRKEKKLTQQNMADRLGISDTQYQNYETDTIPPHDKLILINEILDTDLSRLIYQTKVGVTDGELLKELQALVIKYANSPSLQSKDENPPVVPDARSKKKTSRFLRQFGDKSKAQGRPDAQDSTPAKDK